MVMLGTTKTSSTDKLIYGLGAKDLRGFVKHSKLSDLQIIVLSMRLGGLAEISKVPQMTYREIAKELGVTPNRVEFAYREAAMIITKYKFNELAEDFTMGKYQQNIKRERLYEDPERLYY